MQPTKSKKIWLEVKDLLTGAAFPLMLQLIISASIILFADYNGDVAVQIVVLVFGEALLAAAYVIFGRQNGITAFRRTVQNEKKRAAGSNDIKAWCKTGDYALYKGFLIGFISTVPFMLFQLIECIAHNSPCDFILKYAFGWAVYPFVLIGQTPVGEISEWLNFIWVIVPTCIHALAYFLGARKEKARQEIVAKAQETKHKK